MIRGFGKLLGYVVKIALVVVVLLALPVAYIELACRPSPNERSYAALLPPEHHRDESRTLLTYPEWHIVHAYDDYAEVIRTGNPHDYGFFRSIGQFWGSLCDLSNQSGVYGGFPYDTKQMVYVIGVSFSAEMALKASYEETIGRVYTLIRGDVHSPLDDLSAQQAASYAKFLQQVPWYKYDFKGDITALEAAQTNTTRDKERRFALGAEYAAKSAYAGVIADAVANVGADELTLRMIVKDLPEEKLDGFQGVSVIRKTDAGIEIETLRYRALTELMVEMANQGVNFVEIAGNDDIMMTVLSDERNLQGAFSNLPRQGYGDIRHLVLLKVTGLGDRLRDIAKGSDRLEHVHDY